jgi:putative ABC transport system permease protein
VIAGLHLAVRHALAHPWRTLLLGACLAATFAVPLAAARVLAVYETALRSRASSTPVVVGPAGSRFDLAFAALWFRQTDLDPVPRSVLDRLAHPDVTLLPLHVRATVRLDPAEPASPMVATTPEYLEFRRLTPVAGTIPMLLGDATLGSTAARRLGLRVGDTVFTDPLDLYDITLPPTIELTVVGILAETGTPDDDAVFTSLQTGWLVDGLLHGHDDAAEMADADDERVLARAGGNIAIAPGIIEDQVIRADQLRRVHAHGEMDDAPLTAVIIRPRPELSAERQAKARTIVSARADADPLRRAIDPVDVFDELLGFAVRIKQLVDVLAVVLGGCTAALVGLVTALSTRARAAEFRTLHDIGAPRRIASIAIAAELLFIGVIAVAVAWGAGELAATVGQRFLLP